MALNDQRIIAEMGRISDEVYDNDPSGVKYFKTNPETMLIDTVFGTTVYTVIDYISTPADMQALLLKKSGADEYVIAFRGTEPETWTNWGGDIREDLVIGLQNYSLQYQDALAFVQSVLADSNYTITTDNLTLSGHSLGGILTQAVGAVLEIESYAFNPYGTERLLTMPVNGDIGLIDSLISVCIYAVLDAFGLDSSYAESAKENVLNIMYSDFGSLNGDILSNFLTELTSEHLGALLPIFGENVGLDGHSMGVVNAAIQHYNEILTHFIETTMNDLSLAYIVSGNDGYNRAEAVFAELNIAGTPDHSLTLDVFAVTDSEGNLNAFAPYDIENKARNDIAYRYALVKLNPFAVVGENSIYDSFNSNGALDLFDRETGTGQLSSMYLTYRAEMLVTKIYYDLKGVDYGDEIDVEITGDWDYTDLGIIGEDGGALLLKIDGNGIEATNHQIIFGSEGGESIQGDIASDHLFGMAGNDTMNGGNDDDYLEGGIGQDTMNGGEGNDTFYIQGSDEDYDIFIGGNGDYDTIIGGSGDDDIRIHDFIEHGIEHIDGREGENHIVGTDDADTWDFTTVEITNIQSLDMGGQNDTLMIPEGGKFPEGITVDGGDGEDTISGSTASDDIDLTQGTLVGFEKIYANDGADSVHVSNLNDYTTIDGGDGVDTLMGSQDEDSFDMRTNPVDNFEKIDLGGGKDTVIFKTLNEESGWTSIAGGAGEDTLAGDEGVNRFDLSKVSVNDFEILDLKGGDDVVFLEGLFTFDRINGGDGDDLLMGSDQADEIDLSTADIEGIERIVTGDGNDQVSLGVTASVTYVDLGSGDDVITVAGTGVIESVNGGEGKDTIKGTEEEDYFDFSEGGFSSCEEVDAAGGDDTIISGRMTSMVLKGGRGFDDYLVYDADVINDSDGQGRVVFYDLVLTGGEAVSGNEDRDVKIYYGDSGEKYKLDGSTLTVEAGNYSLTIENFRKGNLDIELEDRDDPEDDPEDDGGDGGAGQDFSSPLVLDLNGNGITSQSIIESVAHFDLDGDGFKEKVGWIESGDGLLALDRNQNGMIDSGNELFGNYTKDKNGVYFGNGFNALADYDENDDGKIDSKDSVYNALSVWQDENQDGVSQVDELRSLAEFEVESINLNAVEVSVQEARNEISHESSFVQTYVDTQGNLVREEKIVRDVWFQRDTEDTLYSFDNALPEDVVILPEMVGRGRAMNLSHAMTEDEELRSQVESFLENSNTSLVDLYSQAEEILARWTHTDDIDPEMPRGVQNILNHNYINPQALRVFRIYAMARDVAILECFAGKTFLTRVDGELTTDIASTQAAQSVKEKYEYLRDTVVITLLAQDLFGKDIYDDITGGFDTEELFNRLQDELMAGNNLQRRTATVNLLSSLLSRDRLAVFEYLDSSILRVPEIQSLLNLNDIDLSIDSDGAVVGSIMDMIYAGSGDDQIYGSGTINGGDGNDTLTGMDGHDVLYGGAGDDELDGGVGSDILYGGDGNDILNTGSGYGHDVLIGGHGDDLLTGSYRSSTYVYTYGDGHDTIIDLGQVGNTPDVLEFVGVRSDDVHVERQKNDVVIFIRDLSANSNGDSGSIRIVNCFGKGKIERFEFEDQALDLNHLLLTAGYYDSDYTYSLSDGLITLNDINGIDQLIFGEGITSEDLVFKTSLNNDDLIIGLKEGDTPFSDLIHKIVIVDGLTSVKRIEKFVFYDGASLDLNQLLQLQGTDEGETIRLLDDDGSVNGLGGDDSVTAGSGSHQITGGLGNDYLSGGAGDDVYIFNRGDGKDVVAELGGSDVLRFGEGVLGEDLVFARENDDVIIGLKEEDKVLSEFSDVITLKEWYQAGHRIETIEFSDGEVMNASDILTRLVGSDGMVYGLEVDDSIVGTEQDNVIFGQGGNDNISGGGGNDQLYGQAGNDALAGDGGDDYLAGGAGNDQYVYSRGDGHDVVDESLYADGNTSIQENGGSDTLLFGSNILVDDLIFVRNDDDLLIGLKEDGKSFEQLADTICLTNWNLSNTRIEFFEFADGRVFSAGELIQFLGSEGDDHIIGLDVDSVFSSSLGDDSFTGFDGNDIYHFSLGHGSSVIFDVGGSDRLVLDEGIAPEDLDIFWQQGTEDIVITFKASPGDQITLQEWYSASNRIESVEFSDGTIWGATDVINAMGTDGDDIYTGLKGQTNIIYSRDGDDIVSTDFGDDQIYGGKGNDGLDAQDGDDILAGESGDDSLWGGAGDDIYMYDRGDGRDFIFDDDLLVTDAGFDILRLGGGIMKEDLVFRIDPDSNDLLIGIVSPDAPNISFDELQDKITIRDWYLAKNRIEKIELTSTGESLSVQEIMSAMGTDGDDVIKALSEGSLLDGQSGNDSLYGNVGNDSLLGNDGDDYLAGDFGDDLLAGGSGSDQLFGQGGDDVYKFSRGDGCDTILDSATISYYTYGWVFNEVSGDSRWERVLAYRAIDGGEDSVLFGDNISPDDVLVHTSGNNITIAVKEDDKSFDELSDKLTITDFYNVGNKIEHFVFSDGQTLTAQEILNLIFTDGDDNVIFETETAQIVFARSGDDVVVGGAGDDQITGERGNDFLNGGSGNDTYFFARGDGRDIIEDKGLEDWWELRSAQDRIHFQGGVTREDLVIFWGGEISEENHNDLIIAIREDGVDLFDLSDYIIVKDWFNRKTKVEVLSFDDGMTLDVQGIIDSIFTENADVVDFSDADVGLKLNALGGDDKIIATNSADSIHGAEGNDTVFGNNGADEIDGGPGSDELHGGAGDDTYIFSRGDGIDVIDDSVIFEQSDLFLDRFGHGEWQTFFKSAAAGSDTLLFQEGISADDLIFFWDKNSNGGNDLIVALKNPDTPDTAFEELTDRITIKNWFYRDPESQTNIFELEDDDFDCAVSQRFYHSQIETFAFSDGSTLSGQDLLNAMSSERDDRIEGLVGRESILRGLAGNDVLVGQDEADALYGGTGNDHLEGGYGENLLDGGIGDDTYVLTAENTGPWDARVSYDTLSDSEGLDTVLFNNDIAREDIVFTLDGEDLIVHYGLELQHQLRIIGNSVERFELSDGSYINRDEVNASFVAIAALSGGSVPDAIHCTPEY